MKICWPYFFNKSYSLQLDNYAQKWICTSYISLEYKYFKSILESICRMHACICPHCLFCIVGLLSLSTITGCPNKHGNLETNSISYQHLNYYSWEFQNVVYPKIIY